MDLQVGSSVIYFPIIKLMANLYTIFMKLSNLSPLELWYKYNNNIRNDYYYSNDHNHINRKKKHE